MTNSNTSMPLASILPSLQVNGEIVSLPVTNTPKRVVLSSGSLNAPIILIGEAPGKDEEKDGLPFVGRAGKFLDMLLEKAGIHRNDCYITNVVKIRPPDNKLKRLPELGVQVEDYLPYFRAELSMCKDARVIIPMGDTAMEALLGHGGISKYRGSVLGCSYPYIVPTLHPSYIMQYGYGFHRVVINDLQRARSAGRGTFQRIERSYRVASTIPEVARYVEMCKRAGVMAYDIETRYRQITCLGLAVSATDALVIPFKNGYQNWWSYSDELDIWSLLQDLFNTSGLLKIGQNAYRYDNLYLSDYFNGFHAPPWFDTQLASALIMPELPHDLAFLTSIYTDMIYYKDDTKDETGKKFKCDMPTLFEYNSKDCMATFEVAKTQMLELEQLGMERYFCGYLMPLYRALGEVTQRGVLIDQTERAKFDWWYQAQADGIQEEIETELGRKINIRSSKQVSALLYDDLKLPKKYDRKTKKVTTGKGAIAELLAEHDNPLLQKIADLRSLLVLLSTFVRSELDADGRIRTSYGITETQRLSSTATIWNTGANLQNIPPEFRVVFIADEGYELTKADKAQAEARAVAALSNCNAMKELFNKGEDIFKYVASIAFNIPESEVTKERRQDAKRITHGSNYRMGARLFSHNIGRSLKDGRDIQHRYFARFPEITLWHRRIDHAIQRGERMVSPFGRVRIFTGRFDEKTYKEATADMPQHTVVVDVNLGLLKLHYLLPDGAHVVLQVHDEVVVLHKAELRNEVVQLLKHVYSRPIYINNEPLVIPIEIKNGRNWYEMKEIK